MVNDKKYKVEKMEPCCPTKPVVENRPLLSEDSATSLELTFKILANSTRLRILHSLTLFDELCVSDIADKLSMKPTAVSNQLQRLSSRGIIGYRRNGNHIFYHIIDTCVVKLLDSGWCLAEDTQVRLFEGNGK